MDYQTFKVSHNFCIDVIPTRGFTLSDHQKDEIETIWRQEQSQSSSPLFNGQLLNLIQLEENKIVGEFIEYKYYLAQLRHPSFKELLCIRPVCISAITCVGDKVLMGERSSNVTQYQNYFEVVPSGGIDEKCLVNETIDLPRQFEKELWEETRISMTEIKKNEIFSLIYDFKEDSYELCAEIHLNYSILKEPISPTEEYQQFQWYLKKELKSFVNSNQTKIVPFSLHILKLRGFL
jgi:hypothetical protein